MSTPSFLTRVVLPAILAACVHLGAAAAAHADQGDCSQPVSSGDNPVASDCLFVLRAAVQSETCQVCVCDTNGSDDITATDALICLNVAVGQDVPLACPQCADTTTTSTTSTSSSSSTSTTTLAVCGNDIHEFGEECDDGNTADNDGCSSTCTEEAPPLTENGDRSHSATTAAADDNGDSPLYGKGDCPLCLPVLEKGTCPLFRGSAFDAVAEEGADVAGALVGSGIGAAIQTHVTAHLLN